MKKLNNLDDLRNMVLDTIEKLSENKIDIHEAGILAKLSETVISGLKTQIEYAKLIDNQPSIPFIDNCARVIEGNKIENNLLEGIENE